MEVLITNGIKITVRPEYEVIHSEPDQGKYIFSYEVMIENLSEHTVQLLRRHWYIFDSAVGYKEITGEGVVGQQPILLAGASHIYHSWCPLTSDLGRMYGFYEFKKIGEETVFPVRIPEFELIAPFRLN